MAGREWPVNWESKVWDEGKGISGSGNVYLPLLLLLSLSLSL